VLTIKRIIAGILSFFAPIWIIIVMIVSVYIALFMENSTSQIEEEFFPFMIAFLIITVFFVLTTITLMIVYIVHASKNKNFSSSEKLAWIFSLYMFNIFVIPIYWYFYIFKKQTLTE